MASADYTILTPERVGLEYGIAGIGSRGAAAIVDTLIQGIALTLVFVGGSAAVVALQGNLRDWGLVFSGPGVFVLFGLMALLGFIVTSGYFMFFEIVWSGQTPGKRLVGVRVIRENGYPIRPVDAVIRNLVRYVDWLPIAYGVGLLVMLLNARSRRLGDFASGTLVVREGSRRPLPRFEPPPRMATTTDQRALVTLTAADATLARDFLVRRETLDSRARAALAVRLATALARRYHVPFEPEADAHADAERFLEHLSA